MVDLAKMRRLMRQLPRKLRAIDDAMAKATNITPSLSGMPHGSGVHSKTEDGALDVIAAKEAYHDIIKSLDEMGNELEPYIDRIDDYAVRVCMRLRYICRLSYYDDKFTNTAGYVPMTCYRKIQKGERIIERMIEDESRDAKYE